MVLSNKKLKQKLRASLAESFTASEEARKDPATNDCGNPDTNSKARNSLKSLLDSASQKPKLSKREKRRKALSLLGPEDLKKRRGGGDLEKENGDGGSEKLIEKKGKGKRKRKRDDGLESVGSEDAGNEEGGSEGLNEKKKKKRDEGLESVVSEGAENEEGGSEGLNGKKRKRDEVSTNGISESVENLAEKKTKKKKKKKKKSKKGKKEEVEEVKEEQENSSNRESEQGVAETIKASDSQETVDVSTKVYVGGIPYYSSEDDIRSYFESCGTITEVDCMRFPESGKFRGIAIINFKTEAAAKRALAFDGSDMGGLFLKIQRYKSTRDNYKVTRAKEVSDFGPAIVEGYNRIYVGNLSWDITEDELRELFSGCNISAIRFGEDKETGKFRGYAHVDFTDGLSLNMALKLDQEIVCGRPVKISCAVPKKATAINLTSVSTSDEANKVGADPVSNLTSVPASNEANKGDNNENGGTDNGGTSSVSGKIRRRTCYECGEKGHLSSSCPKKQDADPTSSIAT